MGFQHEQLFHVGQTIKDTQGAATLIHNTGKLNLPEGIQEDTHNFRPTKHPTSPINNKQQITKV
jgi:hypothetical protein